MDIKDLNRSQFLLLIWLIMFVSSITTAIVTVTLMDQSPNGGVSGTINKVIERVVPGATTTIVKIVKETPTASEGEQIVKSMERVAPLVVRIDKKSDKGTDNLGTGFVVRDDLVATALKNLPNDGNDVFLVKGDLNLPGQIVTRDVSNSIALIKFVATSTLSTSNLVLSQALPTSGQTSVALSYSDSGSPEIMMGIVMGVINANSSTTTPNSATANVIRTGAVIGDNIGGPVIDTAGEVEGIGISRGYALSASTLKALVDQVK